MCFQTNIYVLNVFTSNISLANRKTGFSKFLVEQLQKEVGRRGVVYRDEAEFDVARHGK
jgi:hypothetical protein